MPIARKTSRPTFTSALLVLCLTCILPAIACAESIGRHYDDWVETLAPEGEEDTKMWVPAIAVVDLTGDGLEDIVYFGQHPGCCIGEYGQDPEKMHIMVRNEDGIMENRTGELMNGPPIVLQGGANNIFPADYNGDGRMDLFLEVSGQEVTGVDDPGGQNRLLLMGEDGRLLDVTETHLPQWMDKTHFSGVGDFDGDGDVDVFVNTLGMWNQQADGWKRETPGGTGYLMFNDGTGHFEVVADFGGGFDWPFFSIGPNGRLPEDEVYGGHWAIVPVDADGDGDLDIVLGDTAVFQTCPTLPYCENAEERVILMNDGTGRFSRGPENMVPDLEPSAGTPYSHRIEVHHVLDINNDGLDDLVLSQLDAERWDSGHPAPQYVQFLISNGDGTFRDESGARFEHGYVRHHRGFEFRDFDRDGYKDLMIAIAVEPGDPDQVQVHINDGEGYFRQAKHIFAPTEGPGHLLPLDVDGDGDTDLLELGFHWKEGGARYILNKMDFPYGAELDGFLDWDRDHRNYLIGGAHNNVYRGLEGDDVLDGGLGDDSLDGGPGNDELIGGKGDDTFVFHSADLGDHDTIEDKAGFDRIEFDGFNLGEVANAEQDDDGNLVIHFNDGGSVTVQDHFKGGSYGIEYLVAGGDTLPLSRDPSFTSGNIQELTDAMTINAGMNDAWVSAGAPFQGMFITVFPVLKFMFAAWFTFDSKVPPEDATATFGAPDQRWVTALGSYDGNRAELKAELTTGGSFNSSSPVPTQDTNYGTVNIEMSHCNLISVEYDFPTVNESGFFTASRAVESNVALCESLNTP